ncbi:MAG: DUF4339 domain-containing protein [Planctomycetaceae bacterium]|nr:DUF4339 domain-containing protein [Planctomycetaceae bacterium]
MATDEWRYSTGDDNEQGPVSTAELGRLAETGQLKPDDLVWKEGMAKWVPASRVKGLKFVVAAPAAPPPMPSATFSAQSLKATLQEAQLRADEAAGALWFLDLKFNRFISATLVRGVWMVYLLLVALGVVLGTLGSILRYPIHLAVLGAVGSLLLAGLTTVMFRMLLEAFMVVFRIAEHLREIRDETVSH